MQWESLFRLCHVCGFVNEAKEEVVRCSKCAKAFLPLTSLEKIMLAAGLHQHSGASGTTGVAPHENPLQYAVIQGLMVFW